MYIPRIWIRTSATGRTPDGRELPVTTWGWGDDEDSAKAEGTNRLGRLLERIGRGESFPDSKYAYGNRPLREEILEVLGGDENAEPAALLTRNGYGVQVLNTAQFLFLDIDLPPSTGLQQLLVGLRLKRDTREAEALATLREALQRSRRTTFRIYRTAAGFRVIAVDRGFDPVGREAQELMESTGTDPAFAKLCGVQKSFRARLTPKPWRCDSPRMPGQYPQQDRAAQQRFEAWLSRYEDACRPFATCRYLETVGSGSASGTAAELLALHDRVTRCEEMLPLA